jgi:PKD repeat protein
MNGLPGRTFAALLISVCAILLIGAASASATPTWVDLGLLSAAGENAFEPVVAVDQAGDAVAAWARSNGSNAIVQAATFPAGGNFSAPVDLSLPGESASDLQVAMDPAGDAVVVWERSNGSNFVVQAATRTAGGGFSTPFDLSASGENAFAPQVAMDQAGDAVVVWQGSNGTNKIIQAATRQFGRPFSSPLNLSEPGQDAFEPQVAVDPAGDAVVVWDRSDGNNTIVQEAFRPAHSSFVTSFDLSAPGQSASEPQVALDAIGDTTIVWDRFDGADTIVQALTEPRSGGNSTPVDLSAVGQNAGFPQVAVDSAGDAVVVWARSNGTNQIIQAATQPAGGSFSGPVDLSVTGQNGISPQVAIDPSGDAIVLWDHDNTVAFTSRPVGRSFSAQTDLTNAGAPQVAMDQAGDAFGVWTRFNGSNFIVEGAGFDFAGPQLRNLAIPSSAAVGVPVRFSVAPLDVFSGSSTGWIFGDGHTAGGDRNTVSHTYAVPGTYQVTVTSTDGEGNTSSATRAITITPASLSGLRITPRSFTLAGRRVAGHCVKPTAANSSHRRCRRPIVLHVSYTLSSPSAVTFRLSPVGASFTDHGRAGSNSVTLAGVVDGHPLQPGSYDLTATPTGGKPHSVTFTIVR